jgi:drug/metabolite transporter (DMT)-like permease
MSRQFLGYLYLTLAMMLVGSTVVAGKIIATGLPPFTATAIRFAIALPIFLTVMGLTGTGWPRLRLGDWIILILQAGAGSVGYTTLLISGLRLTSATNAGVVIGTLPVVSAVIAILILGERPHRFLLMAIALAAIGVVSIAGRSAGEAVSDGGLQGLIGNGLIFAAVLCEGLFILLNKSLRVAIPPLVLSTLMTGIGLAVSIIPAMFEVLVPADGITGMTRASFLAVVYYALVPTVGGFLLWYAGAARVSGAEASLFTAIAPVSAVLLAVILLHEKLGWHQAIGIGCVLAAVLGLGLTRKIRFSDRR